MVGVDMSRGTGDTKAVIPDSIGQQAGNSDSVLPRERSG